MDEKHLKLEDLGLPREGQALYEEVIAIQEELKSRHVITQKLLNKDIVSNLLKEEEPLINKILPHIEKQLFQETIRRLCLLYIKFVPERKDEINEILDLRSQLFYGINVQSFQNDHQNISGELLTVVLENAYRPFCLALAEKLRSFTDLETWKKNYCPVCGKKAALASHDEETGHRILWCSFCTTGWSFLRLACPACGSRNHEELRYFYLEEGRNFQIFVCSRCGSYIKVVPRGVIKPENLPLIDAQTASLDLLAGQQGYLRR